MSSQSGNPHPDREGLLRAVSGRDAGARHSVVERTRRAVRIADQSRREHARQGRSSMAVALFALGGILLVLAPVLWRGVDDLLGGEHLGDLPTQVALFCALLLMAVVAALFAGWRTRGVREELRQDPRDLLR